MTKWTLKELRGDRLVQVAALAAAVPLALFYVFVATENVFWQPRSATGVALGVMALVVPVFAGRGTALRSGLAMMAAVVVVTTAWVFSEGPGNLWPLAIMLGTAAAGVPVLIGSVLGGVAATLLGRPPRN